MASQHQVVVLHWRRLALGWEVSSLAMRPRFPGASVRIHLRIDPSTGPRHDHDVSGFKHTCVCLKYASISALPTQSSSSRDGSRRNCCKAVMALRRSAGPRLNRYPKIEQVPTYWLLQVQCSAR